MNEYFNQDSEKEKRQRLRNTMPDAEVILWSRLKGRQILGCKFRRQHSVGPFVMDFYSPEIRLAIELDGDSHYREGRGNTTRNGHSSSRGSRSGLSGF